VWDPASPNRFVAAVVDQSRTALSSLSLAICRSRTVTAEMLTRGSERVGFLTSGEAAEGYEGYDGYEFEMDLAGYH
jgi:hypothetical protein